MRALALVALLGVAIGCQPKVEYVVVKPPRPTMPAEPSDRTATLPKDADELTIIEALMKDFLDYKLAYRELKKIVEATTEPPKNKK